MWYAQVSDRTSANLFATCRPTCHCYYPGFVDTEMGNAAGHTPGKLTSPAAASLIRRGLERNEAVSGT